MVCFVFTRALVDSSYWLSIVKMNGTVGPVFQLRIWGTLVDVMRFAVGVPSGAP